jgi:transposase
VEATVAERDLLIAELRAENAELRRRLESDSSNSSRPPSSDSPWNKKPAKARSSRQRSGRKPGKQPGDPGMSRSLSDNPDQVVPIEPRECSQCQASLADAPGAVAERRQVVDLPPTPAPVITEYQRLSKTCPCCATVTTADWAGTGSDDVNAGVIGTPGSPVRIGPHVLAMCALLTCGHYLPVGRATALLETLTGLHVATGFTARARRRAAAKLLATFTPHLKDLLRRAPVLHADETTGRAAGALAYVHVACTEYLTLMHVGGRSSADIDNGGVLAEFTGVLVRDGYAGYEHLPAVHAWCGAHLLRDLRSISDADPTGQFAMADTLTAAHRAACTARERNQDRLDPAMLATLMNHYLGALAKGHADNLGHTGELAGKARTLIRRFQRYQDMILRFATDLSVPWTNNMAERDVRPVKIQQRTSGGCWRTLEGLTEFAVVHSYLATAAKWGKDKYQALTELFTTGAWLPPALAPS